MKKFKELMSNRWFANAFAGCITVAFYLLVSNLGMVFGGISQFLGYFSTVVGGCVIAYLMNPLAKLYNRVAFSKVKSEKMRWKLSVGLAVTTVLLFVILLLLLLIPQLLESVTSFVNNIGSYSKSLLKILKDFGLSVSESSNSSGVQNLLASSEDVINTVVDYITGNSSKIISMSTNAGKGIANWVIAFILSVYFLVGKDKLKTGVKKLMSVTMRSDVYSSSILFLTHCDSILNRYIIFSIFDGAIVGVCTAIFMLIAGMEYVGLVSVIVGITNLVPTFGPFVGGAIGVFILLMVKPWYAFVFIIFAIILQILDGYVIKPKLFGNTFGVSGLLILLAIVIGGRIFGVIGILLAIPFAAICDYIYREVFIKKLEYDRLEKGEKTTEEHSEIDIPIENETKE